MKLTSMRQNAHSMNSHLLKRAKTTMNRPLRATGQASIPMLIQMLLPAIKSTQHRMRKTKQQIFKQGRGMLLSNSNQFRMVSRCNILMGAQWLEQTQVTCNWSNLTNIPQCKLPPAAHAIIQQNPNRVIIM